MPIHPLIRDTRKIAVKRALDGGINDMRRHWGISRVKMLIGFDHQQTFLLEIEAKIGKDLNPQHLGAF